MQNYTNEECENFRKAILLVVENNKHGGWVNYIRRNHPEYIEFLNWKYPQIVDRALKTKIHWLKYNVLDFPECPVCHRKYGQTIDLNIDDDYPGHCSCSCTQLDKIVRDKNAATNMERYGVVNGAQSRQAQEKMKAACLEKYGVDNVFKSEYFKNKIIKQNLEKYGVRNPHQRPEVIEKTKRTNLKKYGSVVPPNFKCYNTSKGEKEIYEKCREFYSGIIIQNDTQALGGLELDIWIPDMKLEIEYDGDYWHSIPAMKKRDIFKDRLCKEKNITLVRIGQHDYISHPDMVIDNLRKLLTEGSKIC